MDEVEPGRSRGPGKTVGHDRDGIDRHRRKAPERFERPGRRVGTFDGVGHRVRNAAQETGRQGTARRRREGLPESGPPPARQRGGELARAAREDAPQNRLASLPEPRLEPGRGRPDYADGRHVAALAVLPENFVDAGMDSCPLQERGEGSDVPTPPAPDRPRAGRREEERPRPQGGLFPPDDRRRQHRGDEIWVGRGGGVQVDAPGVAVPCDVGGTGRTGVKGLGRRIGIEIDRERRTAPRAREKLFEDRAPSIERPPLALAEAPGDGAARFAREGSEEAFPIDDPVAPGGTRAARSETEYPGEHDRDEHAAPLRSGARRCALPRSWPRAPRRRSSRRKESSARASRTSRARSSTGDAGRRA